MPQKQIRWVFDDNKRIIFYSSQKKHISCGYSIEAPQRGYSYEYPQFKFLWRDMEKFP